MIQKKIIYGCDGRGDGNKPYLTRYTLIERPNWQLCIHVFHRSDFPDFHDHPWDFLTLVLWRGYIENLPPGSKRFGQEFGTIKRRVWPGQILYRPATHTHWVELLTGAWSPDDAEELPAVTLVLMGRRKREWGFWLRGRWWHWRTYFEEKDC